MWDWILALVVAYFLIGRINADRRISELAKRLMHVGRKTNEMQMQLNMADYLFSKLSKRLDSLETPSLHPEFEEELLAAKLEDVKQENQILKRRNEDLEMLYNKDYL